MVIFQFSTYSQLHYCSALPAATLHLQVKSKTFEFCWKLWFHLRPHDELHSKSINTLRCSNYFRLAAHYFRCPHAPHRTVSPSFPSLKFPSGHQAPSQRQLQSFCDSFISFYLHASRCQGLNACTPLSLPLPQRTPCNPIWPLLALAAICFHLITFHTLPTQSVYPLCSHPSSLLLHNFCMRWHVKMLHKSPGDVLPCCLYLSCTCCCCSCCCCYCCYAGVCSGRDWCWCFN